MHQHIFLTIQLVVLLVQLEHSQFNKLQVILIIIYAKIVLQIAQ